MDSDGSPFTLRQRRVVAYRGRGPIYNWLRAQHDAIAPLLAGGTATWPALCAEMVRQGVIGRGAGTPTPNAAVRVWQRVQRDVAAAKRKKATISERVGGIPPSRLPKHWRPVETRPPPAGRLSAGPRPPSTGPDLVPVAASGEPSLAERRPDLLMSHQEQMDFLAGRGPKLFPDSDTYDWQSEKKRLRGEMNLRSGLPWHDPGHYADKK